MLKANGSFMDNVINETEASLNDVCVGVNANALEILANLKEQVTGEDGVIGSNFDVFKDTQECIGLVDNLIDSCAILFVDEQDAALNAVYEELKGVDSETKLKRTKHYGIVTTYSDFRKKVEQAGRKLRKQRKVAEVEESNDNFKPLTATAEDDFNYHYVNYLDNNKLVNTDRKTLGLQVYDLLDEFYQDADVEEGLYQTNGIVQIMRFDLMGNAYLDTLDVEGVKSEVANCLRLVKITENKDGDFSSDILNDVPSRVANELLKGRGVLSQMRELIACVNHPILIKDGDTYKLITEPGYHADSKVYINNRNYDHTQIAVDYPLDVCINILSEVFCDFPYESKVDDNVICSDFVTSVSQLFTPILRLHCQ